MRTCEHVVCNQPTTLCFRKLGIIRAFSTLYFVTEIIEYKTSCGVNCMKVEAVSFHDGNQQEPISTVLPLERMWANNESREHYTPCKQRKEWANTW